MSGDNSLFGATKQKPILYNDSIIRWQNQLGLQGCTEKILEIFPGFKKSEKLMRSLKGRVSGLMLQYKRAKSETAKKEVKAKEFKGPDEFVTQLGGMRVSPVTNNNDSSSDCNNFQKELRPRRTKQVAEAHDEDSNDSDGVAGGRGGATRRTNAARVNYNVKEMASAKTNYYAYDADGRMVNCGGLNLCDCLELTCPGCHFACVKCGSEKCGSECRARRKWVYDHVEIEGTDYKIKNPANSKGKIST